MGSATSEGFRDPVTLSPVSMSSSQFYVLHTLFSRHLLKPSECRATNLDLELLDPKSPHRTRWYSIYLQQRIWLITPIRRSRCHCRLF